MGKEELSKGGSKLKLEPFCFHTSGHYSIALCSRSRNLLGSGVIGNTRQGFFIEVTILGCPTPLDETWEMNFPLKWLRKTSSVDFSSTESILSFCCNPAVQMGTTAHGLNVETHRLKPAPAEPVVAPVGATLAREEGRVGDNSCSCEKTAERMLGQAR